MAPAGLASGTVLGDFEIERPLSSGGMGAVYVAVQRSTGKRRALKVMRPELVADERNRRRFVEEARIGSRIDSAHVVEVVGAGVDQVTGVPWLAMELLDGHDLSDHVARRGPVSFDELLDLYDQLSHALGRAHDVGVIHRDLKPENLFLADSRQRGGRPMLKILDFGIATFVAEDETAATVTSAIGSPLWIAPEQASTGAKLRASTDVWALGLIAFHLLTGHHYWPAAEAKPFNLHALLAEILAAPLPRASERAAALGVADRLPPGFDEWFAACVARDPAARYTDARSAVEGLSRLAGMPSVPRTVELDTSARPQPTPERSISPTERLPAQAARSAPTEPIAPDRAGQPEPRSTGHARSRTLLLGAVALVALVAVVGGIAAYGGDSPEETASDGSSGAHDSSARATEPSDPAQHDEPAPIEPAVSVISTSQPQISEPVTPAVAPVAPEPVVPAAATHACVGHYTRRFRIGSSSCYIDESSTSRTSRTAGTAVRVRAATGRDARRPVACATAIARAAASMPRDSPCRSRSRDCARRR